MTHKLCIICSADNSKYKCPTCKELYCSAKCCQIHKQAKCIAVQQQVKIERQTMEFLTEDTVPVEELNKLDTSQELKNLLGNPHLRNYLIDVDTAKDPEVAIQMAMQEPLFVEFADACLQVLEPPDRETKFYNKVDTENILS